MTEPPVAGGWYLVPCVRGRYFDRLDDWPVIGPEHADPDFFNFPEQHYHVDGRFLSQRQWSRLGRLESMWPPLPWKTRTADQWLHGAPLAVTSRVNQDGLPAPVLRRRRCGYATLPYPFGDQEAVGKLRAFHAGGQCVRGKAGWICPHRKASLGSIEPVDGVITCPLHGLRIDAETGRVLPPPDRLPHEPPPVPEGLTVLDLDEILSTPRAEPAPSPEPPR